jgi:hypothetical protein
MRSTLKRTQSNVRTCLQHVSCLSRRILFDGDVNDPLACY